MADVAAIRLMGGEPAGPRSALVIARVTDWIWSSAISASTMMNRMREVPPSF
jgi:hypothetical protein